ncbi:hypothetical protein [Actinomadura sp. HBU206391]|uniref:hypothetical protein n=1 Tax=Actinomadura sp. HBU206391 TaxID=2731692 RepID=UPI00165036AF|nr:hypothetical protein [Actinomadura sp. HBU206391]MBC6463836.1 hypothetical protein [Actinomadura sp. HBU206391]
MFNTARNEMYKDLPHPRSVDRAQWVDAAMRRYGELEADEYLLNEELYKAIGHDTESAVDRFTDESVTTEQERRRSKKLPPMTEKDERAFREKKFKEALMASDHTPGTFEHEWEQAQEKCILIVCWVPRELPE